LPWQRPFDTQSRLCIHRIAWPRKPTPRIKLRVASYHITKVMAHQTPKPVIGNCIPKLVAMATSLSTYSTYGPPSNTIPKAHPTPQPKRHPYRFSRLCTVCTDDRIECPYTLQWDAHSSPSHSMCFVITAHSNWQWTVEGSVFGTICLWFLWPPYVTGQVIIFLSCGFFLLSFFPRLISAAADWMSTVLPHMVWPLCDFRMQVWNVLYAAHWKYRTQKISILAPSHNFVGLYLRN